MSVNRKVQDFWRGSQFENLGDILSQQRTLLSKVEISHKLSVIDPALSKAALIYRSNQLFNLIKKIPQEVIDAVTKDISPIVSGELICWQPYDADPTSDDSGWRYGRTLEINNELAIQELYVDTSGVPTPVGTPHMRANDSFPTDWSDTHRLAIWGNPKSSKTTFIRGRMDSNIVPNELWLFLDESTSIRLSDFSISRITKSKQLRKTGRPACESKWKSILGSFDFAKVWGSIGTFLTSPQKEKHWHLLLHRRLLFRSSDKRDPSNRCRLCNYWKENQLHFLRCHKLASVRNTVYKLLSAMGVPRSEILSSKAWLTGLNTHNKLIPEACLSLLRIYINVTYRNLTKVLTDQTKFNSWRVSQEVCRDFMSSILAYQKERQEFSLSRKFTSLQHILPLKAVAQARPLGELNPRTGQLKIHPSIELIIKKYKVWTDFSPNCH